jgi:hypothetical protein
MNRNTASRLGRTILVGLVVATAIVTTAAASATTAQFSPPPGATAEPVAPSTGQSSPPPGATAEPVAPSTGQPALSPEATAEPAAGSTVQPSGAQDTPALNIPAIEGQGGLDWADAGIGAGIALGSILLLGGALLVVRGQRHRLATH